MRGFPSTHKRATPIFDGGGFDNKRVRITVRNKKGLTKYYMRKGFTLIELVMVIVILGILSAIAVPLFSNLSKKAEEGLTKQFAGALKEAYTNYILRLALEGKPTVVSSFNTFVDFSGTASDRNTIKIDNSIRTALADPNATVGTDTTITFNFKSGGVAVYTFDPATQQIQEQYTP